jgi:hypothetical protein
MTVVWFLFSKIGLVLEDSERVGRRSSIFRLETLSYSTRGTAGFGIVPGILSAMGDFSPIDVFNWLQTFYNLGEVRPCSHVLYLVLPCCFAFLP